MDFNWRDKNLSTFIALVVALLLVNMRLELVFEGLSVLAEEDRRS